MNDFDKTIGKLLNDSVDAQLGPRRSAPAFRPGQLTTTPARRGAKPWIMPLVAAACVVAAAVGTIGASQALSHRHQTNPPASQVPPAPVSDPAPSSPAPSSGSAAASSPAISSPAGSHPVQAGTGSTSGSPNTVPVTLAGAKLLLPAGWEARDYAQYEPSGGGTFYPTWCLTPASQPASSQASACPLQFSGISSISNGAYLQVDNQGGLYGNPHYCPPAGAVRSGTVESADTSFGDRAADYRHWHLDCPDGQQVELEQYVVATGPGYILFSSHANAAMHSVMASIARTASLPASTSAVRFNDHGYLRDVRQVSGGYLLSIDRVVPGSSGYVNNNPATYDYLIPTETYLSQYSKPAVGQLVEVYTDGSKVVLLGSG
ncbi:MAG: hypothetical protein ABI140_01500 [Jatrophihabitantaceae bacterium]